MKTMTIREYASLFGVTSDTVRKWELKGKINPRRTSGGHRRYTEEDVRAIDKGIKYKGASHVRCNIIYCRISHTEHQDELTKQIEGLKMFALGRGVKAELVVEVGDGVCMERPKFKELIKGVINNEIATIIVEHESRLISSGYELLCSIAKACRCEIISVSDEVL